MTQPTHHPDQARRFFDLQLGDANLDFIPARIDDPVVTGRQIIELAGKRPVAEHIVFQWLESGALEELRLEETADLRQPGVERFVVFASSESHRIELDGEVREWGLATITETALRRLARIPDHFRVWQERRGQEDLQLPLGAAVDLAAQGLEKFYTGADQTTSGLDLLPERDRRYLENHQLAYQLIGEGGQKGLLLSSYPVPQGRLDHPSIDLLLMMPPAWPDAPTDMFFVTPWLKLPDGQYPQAADVAHSFAGRSWQRWSRHADDWRPGRDGIWTTLRRVDTALRNA